MATDDPVLVEVTRGGVVESRHRGSLVLLDATGATELAVGTSEPVFARSALKPVQAVALLRHGFAGPSEWLALATGSHSGTALHRDTARAVLAAAGLDEHALGCPPDLPMDEAARIEWIAAGGRAAAICHNCSGKHAGMLATCVAAGWHTGGYLDPAHPLQAAVVEQVGELAGTPVARSAVDGCGAPAHAVPLAALARAFGRIAGAEDGAPAAVAAAMRAHPVLVAGPGRPVTELMADVPGLVCKEGAEGVWAAALPDGRAFAAKVSDGATRALGPLLAAVLASWGCTGPAVTRWSAVPTLGGGQPVGAVVASDELRALLAG